MASPGQQPGIWSDGRAVDCAVLERQRTFMGSGGSNPPRSARYSYPDLMCRARGASLGNRTYGSVGEWFMPTVLKTVEPKGSVGSNPTASAIKTPLILYTLSIRDSSTSGYRVRIEYPD